MTVRRSDPLKREAACNDYHFRYSQSMVDLFAVRHTVDLNTCRSCITLQCTCTFFIDRIDPQRKRGHNRPEAKKFEVGALARLAVAQSSDCPPRGVACYADAV